MFIKKCDIKPQKSYMWKVSGKIYLNEIIQFATRFLLLRVKGRSEKKVGIFPVIFAKGLI